jgi:hypothetical protein
MESSEAALPVSYARYLIRRHGCGMPLVQRPDRSRLQRQPNRKDAPSLGSASIRSGSRAEVADLIEDGDSRLRGDAHVIAGNESVVRGWQYSRAGAVCRPAMAQAEQKMPKTMKSPTGAMKNNPASVNRQVPRIASPRHVMKISWPTAARRARWLPRLGSRVPGSRTRT